MKNRIFTLLTAAALSCALACAVYAGYPSSKTKIPDGSVLLEGEQIGEERGWDGHHGTGRQSAFDGDKYTYYDPTTQGADYAYCGLELDDRYILTKVMILPRENWTDRFDGGSIQGSNDGEDWYTLCESNSAASSWDWQTFTEFESNIGYRYYRYFNAKNHGDVAEVELYGYKGSNGNDPYDTSETVVVSELKVTYSMPDGNEFTMTVNPGGTYPDTLAEHDSEYLGQIFDGWSYTVDGKTDVNDGDRVTRLTDHTLYAVWSASDEIPADEPKNDDASAESAEASASQTGETISGRSKVIIPVCIAVMAVSIAAAAVVITKSQVRRKH